MQIVGETLGRAEVEALLGQGTPAFQECAFDGADLSRLDLRGCSFSNCSIAETSLYAANLAQTVWRRCRGRQVDF